MAKKFTPAPVPPNHFIHDSFVITDEESETAIDRITLSREGYDIVYSRDDGGWYVQRFPDGVTSQSMYLQRQDAITALRDGHVRWDERS